MTEAEPGNSALVDEADPRAVDATAADVAVEDIEIPTEVVLDTGDSALTLTEASSLAAELGATVVLIAGAQAVGKTTMVVTLWGQFLQGPFAGFRFAGSRTLDAFDQRQFASRMSSGNSTADTVRTEDEDLRLLHLRVADQAGCLTDLMPSDIKGEYFEDLVNGRPPVEGLQQLVRRADKVVVAVDGARIVDVQERQQAVLEARLLIGRLTETGWMHPDAPLLLLLTKVDLVVADDVLTWYEGQERILLEFAANRGLRSSMAARVSARPTPIGVEFLLTWMHERVERRRSAPVQVQRSDRVFLSGAPT